MGMAREWAPNDVASIERDGIMARHDNVRRRTGDGSFGTIICLLANCPECEDDVAEASASPTCIDFVEAEDIDV
jgi:hypothetical protein